MAAFSWLPDGGVSLLELVDTDALVNADVSLAGVGLGVDGATVGGVVVGVAVVVDMTMGVAVVGGAVETVVVLGNARIRHHITTL